MSITSSLNAGVAGLNANATRLATISDNIANSNTFGYRRAYADFESLVVGGTRGSGGYTAGGVNATALRLIAESGPLVATSNALDLAVAGRGMLPVRPAVGNGTSGSEQAMQLMRTGAFRPDAQGFLTTESGMLLLGWPADLDGSIPTFPRDSELGLQPIRIDMNQRVGDPTTLVRLGVNLPATATTVGADGDSLPLSVEYFGNLGTSETLAISFTPTVPASGSASNRWTMVIRDSASDNAVIGEYTIQFDDSRGLGGMIDSVTAVSGGAYDAATGNITLNVAGGPISIALGTPGTNTGLTQLDDAFAPAGIVKDGSPIGTLTALEVDAEGYLNASYDTGFSRRLFQIPLVDVPNVAGLMPLAGQTYQVTQQSGAFMLWDAGTGPTGTVAGFAREGSTTDVAAELTALIQTQRAYASNAKVIQTVALSLAEAMDFPVEISDCVRLRFELMDFIVCSATIALLLVRMDDIFVPHEKGAFGAGWPTGSARCADPGPTRHPAAGCPLI
ncbi:flagellar hook-basal body complex protein [Rhodobacter sp. HX-7-19]|uniref:Flagellar hook protein FlgE n=1 Tax=Paragemmobacter kunshanensis TaxID=2583234 RepID=A0A6M1U191_9RHOB|nr:flagellar hook-basal body complex protein [Rhodobacter kunshanensis]